jgi:hypothetical protein
MDENVSKWATGSGVAGMSISRSVTASFNGSQELDLEIQRNFPHFVQKKSSPMGQIEEAGFVCYRPGKRPLFYSQKTRFQSECRERLRNLPLQKVLHCGGLVHEWCAQPSPYRYPILRK